MGNDILFTGREYEAIVRNFFYRARILLSQIGMFIQKDAFVYISGFNDYRYSNNNPVNFKDPSGDVTLKGGVSYTKCFDPSDGPYISAPKYNGPYISTAPQKPEKTFCEEHPKICDPSLELGGEHCNVIGVGACFSGKGRIDKKDGLTKDGDINIGYGLYFSGQINAKLGFGETKKSNRKELMNGVLMQT